MKTDIRYQLSASAVDTAQGILRGVTVAKAGVQAVGKFVLLDASGQVTKDPELARSKLQVVTDNKTLDSLMVAVGAQGGRFKVRSDHDDALAARAGYADNFQKIGDRVVCDIHLNDSYRDREIVMEVSNDTPDLIGLSIDFQPSFDLQKTSALMRVDELHAVDIVDAGAITPAGLFLSEGVDKASNGKSQDALNFMATKPEDSSESSLAAALKSMTDAYGALSGKVESCLSKIAEMSAPAKSDKDGDEKLAASLSEIRTALSAQKEDILTLKKERAALGLKAEPASVKAGAGSPENDAAGRETVKEKTFLELVAEKKSEKLNASDAHSFVMKKHPKAYQAHLLSRGVIARVNA